MFAKTYRTSRHRKGMRGLLFELFIAGSLAMLLSCGGGFVKNVYGATAVVGKITATSGKVRKEASTSSEIAFCVANNDELAILGKGKAKDGTVWYKVSYGDQTGFIRSDLISETKKTIEVSDSLGSSNDKTQASSSSSDSEAKKQDGDTDNKTDKQQDTTSESKKEGTPASINASYVRMRSSASTDSNMVTYLDKDTSVAILGEGKAADGHIWYQIRVGENVGFVRSDFVNKTEDNKEADNKDTEAKDTETKDAEAKDTEAKDAESKNADNKDAEAKDTDNKDAETKDADAKANESADDKNNESTDGVKSPEENAKENQSVGGQSIEGKEGIVKGTAVRVRNLPVSGSVVCQLSNGHPLLVTAVETGSDEQEWLKVSFSYMGSSKEGYIRRDFVTEPETTVSDNVEVGDEEFESMIQAFPDSYKNPLRLLHKDHPNWRFEMVNTGLNWTDALTAESSVGKNLVTKNSVASWKSTATQAYNKASNTWYTFDGGSWVSASSELIAFYMDPRNFLNDSGIFQFEELSYNENQNAEGVSKMLADTFMANPFTDTDGVAANYADVFVMAGQSVGISPYLLAGRAVQEQGINGQSQSISGVVPGYVGYFNYFNIGAYAYSGRSATINGLVYAKGSDETSLRPWNTRVKSIYGGSVYIADNFIKRGQNTLYFQKFNVVNAENTLYSHQYMSNIQAAASESARIQLAYVGSDAALTFRIPVYNNMPQIACSKPTSDASPNSYLESLSVDSCELIPAFTGATEKYTVYVSGDTSSVTINAKSVSDKTEVVATGSCSLNDGDTTLCVTCKAQNGTTKKYTITVKKQ